MTVNLHDAGSAVFSGPSAVSNRHIAALIGLLLARFALHVPAINDDLIQVRVCLEADGHSARQRRVLLRVGELLVEHWVGITRGLSSGLEVLLPAVA